MNIFLNGNLNCTGKTDGNDPAIKNGEYRPGNAAETAFFTDDKRR